jgi:hypothetical protein
VSPYEQSILQATMKPWQDLRWSLFPEFRPIYDKLHDEERLDLESDSESKQRHESSWKVWPMKATGWLFLLIVNLAIFMLLLHTLEPLITLLRLNEQLFSPRVTLPRPSISSPGNKTAQSSRIPLILHQTTATEEIPERWIQPQQSCKKAYSEFEYKVRLFMFIASRDNVQRRQSSSVLNYIYKSLTDILSYGLTLQRATSCPSTTHGSYQSGIITHSQSSGQTRFAILSCITMAAST